MRATTRTWRLIVLAAVFATGLSLGLSGGRSRERPEPPVVRSSFSRDDVGTEAFVRARVKAVRWPGGPGGSLYTIDGPPSPNKNLAIDGPAPLSLPDDHGHTDLAVIGLAGGRATFVVLSRFDHGSFGKNLVTVDCRVVGVDVSTDAP
ncbi:MAG: hypothetical protein JWO31_4178 [Phycisphaerales bacterium]|nr:hypothetical protein [Phycisphaerales bacterium]